MSKFRKKPVVIDAALFDGRLVGAPGKDGKVVSGTCPEWFPAVVKVAAEPPLLNEDGIAAGEVWSAGGELWIGTLEGAHRASPGDWIICGVRGELYPCKPDIFAATYEAVKEAA